MPVPAKSVIFDLLSQGEIARAINAIKHLANSINDDSLHNEVVHQSGRYFAMEKDRQKGVIEEAAYKLERARISQALQSLVQQIPDDLEIPDAFANLQNWSGVGSNLSKPDNLGIVGQSRASNIPWIVGLVLLLLPFSLLIAFMPCPSRGVSGAVNLLMALGAGLVATLLPGLFHLEIKGLKAGSAIGVFVLVFLVDPAGKVRDDSRCPSFAEVTVVVHSADGPYKKILQGQGQVVIEFEQKTEKADIDKNGEAIFLKLPAAWLSEKVKIYLEHPQPYQSLRPDSLYLLKADRKVYIAAALQNADHLFGTITDASNGHFLDSVRVSIQNLATYTDKNGWFDLMIPVDKQQKFQRVTLAKPGYENRVFDSVPIHTQQEFSYPLRKEKKVPKASNKQSF